MNAGYDKGDTPLPSNYFAFDPRKSAAHHLSQSHNPQSTIRNYPGAAQ
jgi:hypothetical protein